MPPKSKQPKKTSEASSSSDVTPKEKKPEPQRFRNYSFTCFACPDKCRVEWNEAKMKYLLYVKEVCPETGNLHWQGYVEFKDAHSESAVRKAYTPTHFEISRKGFQENYDYCVGNCSKKTPAKPEDIHEFGKKPKGQGKRSDVDLVHELCKAGASKLEIAEKVPNAILHYPKGVDTMLSLYTKDRDWVMEVYVFWGPPGSGKTRRAHELYGHSLYVKPKNKWWDGYDGQETVLFDDFDPFSLNRDFAFDQFLTLCDRYGQIVEVKGASLKFRSKRIVFTSMDTPLVWFTNIEHRDAFFRRVVDIIEFSSVNTTTYNPLRTPEQEERVSRYLVPDRDLARKKMADRSSSLFS